MRPTAIASRLDNYAGSPHTDSNMNVSVSAADAGFWTPQLLRSPMSNTNRRSSCVHLKNSYLNGRVRPRTRYIRSTGDEGHLDDSDIHEGLLDSSYVKDEQCHDRYRNCRAKSRTKNVRFSVDEGRGFDSSSHTEPSGDSDSQDTPRDVPYSRERPLNYSNANEGRLVAPNRGAGRFNASGSTEQLANGADTYEGHQNSSSNYEGRLNVFNGHEGRLKRGVSSSNEVRLNSLYPYEGRPNDSKSRVGRIHEFNTYETQQHDSFSYDRRVNSWSNRHDEHMRVPNAEEGRLIGSNHNDERFNGRNHNELRLNGYSHNEGRFNGSIHNEGRLNGCNHNEGRFNGSNHIEGQICVPDTNEEQFIAPNFLERRLDGTNFQNNEWDSAWDGDQLEESDNRRIMQDAHMRLLKAWMEEKAKAYDETNDESLRENGLDDPPPIPASAPPPLPPRRYHDNVYLGNGHHKDGHGRDTSSEEMSQMTSKPMSPRSPLKRSRHKVLRKYTSTPALMPRDDTVHSAKPRGRTQSTESYNNKVGPDSPVTPPSYDQSYWTRNGQTSNQYPVTSSEDKRLSRVDIVGESFQARYPWQRDACTQCDLSNSTNSDANFGTSTSHVLMPHKDNPAMYARSKPRHRVRPQSDGGIENVYRSGEEYQESETNGRQGRLSEPSLRNNNNHHLRRMPVIGVIQDDPDVISDLESISENPTERGFQRPRVSSLESAAINEEISGRLQARLARERREESSVLASPSISPVMWDNVPDVVVNPGPHANNDDSGSELKSYRSMDYLAVPRKHVRRRNSASVTEGSDDSDREISPPVARRGRRAAIVDTKNFGDVSPTNLSPDVSPSESCDESDGTIAERLRVRRSSVELTLNVYPGDLLVQEHHKKLIKRNTISDFYSNRNGSTTNLNEDSKKQRQPFSLLKLMKSRSKESLTHLGDVLQKLKPSEFKDNHLAVYKNLHWSDLIASTDKQPPVSEALNISELERKRRESVWELFKSELVFLIDHLMVLKHCFLEPLKKVQVEGFLMYAEPAEIFGNLDELCYVSYTFCKDFISSLVRDMSASDFGRTHILIKAFQRFSAHSKDGSVYHTYCLNYTNALSNLEKLRKNEDFCEFEKWCEQDHRCNRLQLADLLIGPMQHCTKLPLLLYNIKKYTDDPLDKKQISESIEKVETSLKQLEDKMKWLKNFERVQEIQRHLVWPSVTDLDSRAFVPEYLKPKLLRQPCERLLACPRRQLLHEGAVQLIESTKSFDAFLFLFDDILLITKMKKPNRKKQGSSDPLQPSSGQTDNQTYVVHRQPIALDRLGLHDVSTQEATANGVKFAFVIVQISRFQQIIDVFTIQAPSEALKIMWLSQIREAKNRYCNLNRNRADSTKENEEPLPQSNSNNNISNSCCPSSNNNNNNDTPPEYTSRRASTGRKAHHGKSLSVEAIFL